MTDYGIIVKNKNSEIQIDSLYRNISIETFGSQTLSTPTLSYNIYSGTSDYYLRLTSISITANSLPPIFAWQPATNGFTHVSGLTKTGNNYTSVNIMNEVGQSASIAWRLYRETLAKSNTPYGMLINDEKGNLVFDSGLSYLKIYSTHDITLSLPAYNTNTPPPSMPYTDITHSGVENPYYILSCCNVILAFLHESASISKFTFDSIGLKKLSSTSVRVGWYHIATSTALAVSMIGYQTPTNIFSPVKLIVCYP